MITSDPVHPTSILLYIGMRNKQYMRAVDSLTYVHAILIVLLYASLIIYSHHLLNNEEIKANYIYVHTYEHVCIYTTTLQSKTF